MSLSIQTNVASLNAQENLLINTEFQNKTIQQLTSGYRINNAGDDAAGLAIANGYRDSIAQLNEGVNNGNDGVSQLQIIDGGLSNISEILDRLQTLSTESASSTFTGDRATLNNEYQSLLTEIDRQAANIGLNSGGANNTTLNVFIGGGGNVQGNSQVSVDLSGAANQVSATSLGLANTNLLAAGSAFGTLDLNNVAGGNVLAAGANGSSQVFTFNLAGGQAVNATISSTSSAGISVADAIQQLNNTTSAYGITASENVTTGDLLLSSSNAFTASAAAASNASTGLANTNDVGTNTALYSVDQGQAQNQPVLAFGGVAAAATETLTFTSGGQSTTLNLTNANAGSAATALQTLNTGLAALGINAVLGTGGDIEFQSANNFSITKPDSSAAGVFAATGAAGTFTDTAETPTVTGTAIGNSLQAITAVTNAVQALGLVQGAVGAGENRLQYAINLAQSQITNYTSAESQIRDANIAQEAANLTQAQVLQQSSIAAMAQANASPQALLKLLQG
jgi:flagellin